VKGKNKPGNNLCPCGSGRGFEQCCGPVLKDPRAAASAEALMRSRYTAYTLGASEHILRTWAPETRPREVYIDPARRWLGLKVKRREQGTPGDETGVVEFVARSKVGGKADRAHEVSEFRFDGDMWLYVAAARE